METQKDTPRAVLTRLSANGRANELSMRGIFVLYSYELPVAYMDSTQRAFVVSETFTTTTRKHVETWLKKHGITSSQVALVKREEIERAIIACPACPVCGQDFPQTTAAA